MTSLVHDRVLTELCGLFDRALIQNNLRGLYIERVVANLLGEPWKSVSSDWAAWDVEHADGTRLEVKQSAARQSWVEESAKTPNPVFNIRAARGWTHEGRARKTSRSAHIYAFAWHSIADDRADHRALDQWSFFVLPTSSLPDQQTISLGPLSRLVSPVDAPSLLDAVEKLRKARSLTNLGGSDVHHHQERHHRHP